MRMPVRLALLLAAVVTADVAGVSAQTATWYIPTYTHDILVWDEASEEVVDRIEMENPIPNELVLNEARDRLYVLEATAERMEVVDLATRRVVDAFTLSRGNVTVRIDGFVPHPSGSTALVTVKRYTRLSDRYRVEGPFVLEYDLDAKQVTDTLPWPDGEERDRGFGYRYSPDGETLYYIADDVIALDPDTWEVLDRWRLSQPLEPGLGPPRVDLDSGTYDEPGVATGLFRMTDPVQNRDMLGIARARLADREIEFFTLGTSEPVGDFALAPGGDRAYGLYSEIGRYEFWEFDLADRRLAARQPFPGRPRMGLQVSADGEELYVYVAGNTIDVYDADTFQLLRTVEFDEDMVLGNVVVIPGAAAP